MDTPNPSPAAESPQFDLLHFASKFDFVVTEALVADLSVTTKFDAIQQLVAKLAHAGAIPADREAEILAAVLHREKQAATAIGRGIAIPHAKHPAIPQVVATIGFSPAGIDFDDLDQQPVHLLVLVLSPVDGGAQHLRALQQVVTELSTGDSWK
jgi:mannitol/fructose-specific phosphotransferase system IIA component (Ntr-type)